MSSNATDADYSIRSLFNSAKAQRKDLSSYPDSTTSTYQENLQAAISSLEECRRLARQISLFSPNESEDDIASADLQYLLTDYYLGEMIIKDSGSSRKGVLQRAREAYERYLGLLDNYGMLSKNDKKLYERYLENRDEFTLHSPTDPTSRRDTKIARLKQEKELELKLEYLAQVPKTLDTDESVLREVYNADIQLCAHRTFHALDMIAQEVKILALMPPTPASEAPNPMDSKDRPRADSDNYSERLDRPDIFTNTKAGPLLTKDGKPLKPFTLLDNRQRLRGGVFKPDHSLPTMTIDEYLQEEKRRGGIIDGAGNQSGQSVPIDEDDLNKADQETLKAREWDDYKEDHPRGSGNTLNMG